MKLSIITVVKNNKEFTESCIKSVREQNYSNFEHIIIDGASTDGTVDVIRNHENGNTKVISEPDNGLYDAMNKGVRLSDGDIVGFLNSDDMLYDDRVLESIVKVFYENEIDSCYGYLVYVDKDNTDKVIRYWSISELQNVFSQCIGPTSISVDAYFGLGIQKSDLDLLEIRYKIIVLISKFLKKMSFKLKWMKYLADSIYIKSLSSK